MSNPVFFSILIPNYGKNSFLFDCINNAKSQITDNLFEYEVIICDQSNKMVYEEIEKLITSCGQNSNVFLFHSSIPSLYKSRHLLVSKAKGEYIVFLDSDDLISQDYLKNLFNNIKTKNYPDLVISPLEVLDTKTNLIQKNERYFKILSSKKPIDHFFFGPFLNSAVMKIFKRSLYNINDYGLFDDVTNGEDRVFSYPLVVNAKDIVFLNNPCGYFYRTNMSSMVHTYSFKEIFNAFKIQCELAPIPCKKSEKKICYNSTIEFYYSCCSSLKKRENLSFPDFLAISKYTRMVLKNKSLKLLHSRNIKCYVIGLLLFFNCKKIIYNLL